MSGYLTAEQHAQLLGAINPNRVGKDGKGFSHVEAYEIRAHLNRVFGFGRWSADLTDLALIFERVTGEEKAQRFTVCYRATVRLTVAAPDGTTLATYTEAATGESKNQPSQGDAHDLAIKTAESQALKRGAVNLGDAFGLSLYRKGSLAPLVRATLVTPSGAVPKAKPVDAHITEPLPRESEQSEDQRETNDPKPTAQTREVDAAQVDAIEQRAKTVADFRDALLNPPPTATAPWFARKSLEATQAGIMKALTEDRDGNVVTVGALIQSEQKRPRAAA